MKWPRAVAVWLLMMLVESLHGIARNLLLAPLLGDAQARRVSVATGALLIFLIALLTIRWIGAHRTPALLAIGAIWVLMTVAFEVLLGRHVLGMGWDRITSDYDPSRGGLMTLGLLCMFLSPLVAARLRKV